ncbi:MAG: hypothetical protein GKS06_10545 [Acidobacteria bacterium]|nr:hypothetical protein [Acidobacteriota bacterium]
MGWFDQETKEGSAAPTARPAAPAPSPSSPPKATTASSTIGPRVHINGTVVSDEDLEIVGKVEGTIHARKGLKVAKDADVKAVVHGTDVLVEGTINGDINASETLILGATASLTGNIKTAKLQIREGAFFRGQVAMQPAQKPAPAPEPVATKPEKSDQKVTPDKPADKTPSGKPGDVRKPLTETKQAAPGS